MSDTEKRQTYDNYGEEGLRNGGGEDNFESFNPFDLFGSFFGDGFGSMGFGGYDFFDDGYMGGRSKRSRRSAKVEDIVEELDCSLEDLYLGNEMHPQVKHTIVCKGCGGRGAQNASSTKCKRCNGTGVQVRVMQHGIMRSQVQTSCSMCQGTGRYISASNRCAMCQGSGNVTETRTVTVAVPKGAQNGDTIRLSGAGNQAHGCKPGDVVFVIHENPHPVFKRKDTLLVMKMKISLSEALCGFARTVDTLDHRKLRLVSPRGSVVNVGVGVFREE